MEHCSTKTTKVAKGLYGCRVWYKDRLVVEMRVPRHLVSCAYRDMFRTLDKLGFDSKMAHASRMRGKNHTSVTNYKYIWY